MSDLVLLLHFVLGLLAFGILPLTNIFYHRISANADVQTIRAIFGAATLGGQIGGAAVVLAGLAGFWLVSLMGLSFTSLWLIITYVIFVVLLAVGFGYFAPHGARILALAKTEPDGAPSAQLRAMVNDPLTTYLTYLSAILWFALFYLMIVRPT